MTFRIRRIARVLSRRSKKVKKEIESIDKCLTLQVRMEIAREILKEIEGGEELMTLPHQPLSRSFSLSTVKADPRVRFIVRKFKSLDSN